MSDCILPQPSSHRCLDAAYLATSKRARFRNVYMGDTTAIAPLMARAVLHSPAIIGLA